MHAVIMTSNHLNSKSSSLKLFNITYEYIKPIIVFIISNVRC